MNIDERYNSNFLYFEEKDHRYTDTCGNQNLMYEKETEISRGGVQVLSSMRATDD